MSKEKFDFHQSQKLNTARPKKTFMQERIENIERKIKQEMAAIKKIKSSTVIARAVDRYSQNGREPHHNELLKGKFQIFWGKISNNEKVT